MGQYDNNKIRLESTIFILNINIVLNIEKYMNFSG